MTITVTIEREPDGWIYITDTHPCGFEEVGTHDMADARALADERADLLRAEGNEVTIRDNSPGPWGRTP